MTWSPSCQVELESFCTNTARLQGFFNTSRADGLVCNQGMRLTLISCKRLWIVNKKTASKRHWKIQQTGIPRLCGPHRNCYYQLSSKSCQLCWRTHSCSRSTNFVKAHPKRAPWNPSSHWTTQATVRSSVPLKDLWHNVFGSALELVLKKCSFVVLKLGVLNT